MPKTLFRKMKLIHPCLVFATVAGALLWTATIHAAVEFSTFGTGFSYTHSGGEQIAGAQNGGTLAVADRFTASFTGMLTGVDIGVSTAGFGSDVVDVYLYQNNALTNFPNTQGGISLGEITAVSSGSSVISLNTTSIPLLSGQTYWLGLTPDSSSTFVLWSDATNTAATVDAFSTDGGASYHGGDGQANAFDVNAVPEPSSWALLCVGASLLVLTFARKARVSA